MITTRFDVKFARGDSDGISAVPPDAGFDDTAGYYVGFVLLVQDGDTWICSDASTGAAVWVQDASVDLVISDSIRAATQWVSEYCDSYFSESTQDYASGGISFFPGGSMIDDKAGFIRFFIGDTLKINGSLRNDGWYDVTSVTDTEMFVTPDFPITGEIEGTIYFFVSTFPRDLQLTVSKMIAYDLWTRDIAGVSSESIGTYSYTKGDITDSGYPRDLIAGLNVHKRPRIR